MPVSNIFIDPRREVPRIQPLKAIRHMRTLIADKEDTEQVFHIIEALNGSALRKNLRAFAATKKGRAALDARVELPPVLDDHSWIQDLPANTVGRAYIAFMEREGLSAQGLVEENLKFRKHYEQYDDDLHWFAERLRDTHDLYHVLTGYGRDALGEASLLAFTHGQNPSRGVHFIAFVGSRELVKQLPRDARVMDCYREGKRNGKAAAFLAAEDIIALLKEPLYAARARLNIAEPVAYKRALRVCADAGMAAQEINTAAA